MERLVSLIFTVTPKCPSINVVGIVWSSSLWSLL